MIFFSVMYVPFCLATFYQKHMSYFNIPTLISPIFISQCHYNRIL